MGHPLYRVVFPLSPLPLLPKVFVGQVQKHALVYVAVQGGGTDRNGITLFTGDRQGGVGGVPLTPVYLPVWLYPQHKLFQSPGVVVVIPQFDGPSLGRLVVVVIPLPCIGGVSPFVPPSDRMQISSPAYLIVDGLSAKPHDPGDPGFGLSSPEVCLQLIPLLLRHVVLVLSPHMVPLPSVCVFLALWAAFLPGCLSLYPLP